MLTTSRSIPGRGVEPGRDCQKGGEAVDARLIPLNAFIGLVSPAGSSWPNPLHKAGYELVALELPLDASGERVVADAVAFNDDTNRFLVVETKSGRNIRAEQAKRYGLADARQLVRHTDVTVGREDELAIAPLYVCLSENVDRIQQGLRVAGCDYTVLAVGEDEVAMHGAVPAPQDLADMFSRPLRVPGWPPTIIRVDADSDASEFDMIASQALMVEVNLGKSQISSPELAARAIPQLHIYGTGYRNSLIKNVEQALERQCAASPTNFRFRPPTASRNYALVDVVDSPERADPRGRTQRYQAIRRRFRGQDMKEPSATQQQVLFDSLDLGTELEEPEARGLDAVPGEHEESEP